MRIDQLAVTAVRRAAVVLASNRETAGLAQRLGAAKIQLFQDFSVPEARVAAAVPERRRGDPLRVIWVGGLLPRKAPLLALEAIAALPPGADVELTIVGDGPLRAVVQRSIQDRGLEDRIELAGQLDLAALRAAYGAHHVLQFTSLRDSFGGQVAEAMAAGLPVVALRHQGVAAHVPPDAGFTVVPTTPAATATELGAVLAALEADDSARREAGNAALRTAHSLTWPASAARALELYDQVVSQLQRPVVSLPAPRQEL
jgi:glycosyltransferase involved in cell wall biosynthesis